MSTEQIDHAGNLTPQYSPGYRTELVHMDDPQTPPTGTLGTVAGVDDIGNILVDWDNESGLNAVSGVDIVKRVY